MSRCKICNSEESDVRISLDLDGTSVEVSFCLECAKKFEMDADGLERKGLQGFLGRCKAFTVEDDPNDPCRSCPNCGVSADDVLETGQAGCAFCYIVFRDLPVHNVPLAKQQLDAFVSTECECTRESPEILERLLQEAVSEEDYETAARIRDRLRDGDEPSPSDS